MMDDLRLAAVAARVVAWHNRHPLARRIAASHVHAVGYVALPFVGEAGTDAATIDVALPEAGAGDAGSLRERALARARQQASAAPPAGAAPATAADAPLPALATLQPDFSEDFIDPLRPRDVARFAARTGQVLARPPADGPVREVVADGAHAGRRPARVYLLTAVIETDTRKSRVLLGTGLAAPVLGRRIFDHGRVAALAGLAGLAVGVPAWWLQPADAPPQVVASSAPVVASTVAPVVAPVVAAVAETPASAAPAADEAIVQSQAASAPATAASAPAPAADLPARPAHALARPPVGEAPSIRPVISEEVKAQARQAREALKPPRAVAAASTPAGAPPEPEAAPRPTPVPAPPPAAVPAQAQPRPAPGAAAYALSTRPLRTRAEAEQVQVAMRALLRTVGAAEVKVDVLPQGDDWRVVALPFAQRAPADQARALLVSRGMRVEVIDF